MNPLAELSPPGLDVLWEHLQLGAIPFPFDIRRHGDTVDERARIKTTELTGLHERGLARSGRPVPDLENALRLVAAPELSVDLLVLLDDGDEQPTRALVAKQGRQAILVVQRSRSVHLTTVRDTAMMSSLVDLLPTNRPGPGRSVTVPTSTTTHATPGSGLMRPIATQSSQQVEMQLLTAVLQRPIHRTGVLGITLHNTRGRPRRLPGLTWFDNDQGRYALSIQRGTNTEDWTTLFPADNPRLANRLAQTLATTRDR